jgi:BTB/POZ domain-containing protein 8
VIKHKEIDNFFLSTIALCHIYSGASHPPEGISLMELASLSDLLGLEGLKEVTTYALKTNYCHNFHKVKL